MSICCLLVVKMKILLKCVILGRIVKYLWSLLQIWRRGKGAVYSFVFSPRFLGYGGGDRVVMFVQVIINTPSSKLNI